MLPSRSFKVHTVRRGDSLHVIARKYETDVASLQELNGLKSTSIKVGLPLRIL
nr:LysM peptidoglycan-binding domain-containing protein [Acanthopleuribacter pedis]